MMPPLRMFSAREILAIWHGFRAEEEEAEKRASEGADEQRIRFYEKFYAFFVMEFLSQEREGEGVPPSRRHSLQGRSATLNSIPEESMNGSTEGDAPVTEDVQTQEDVAAISEAEASE